MVGKNDSWLISCPNCSAVNNDLAEFCYNCNLKFGANLDPMGIIYDEGALLRKAAHNKPKLIVLIGTWLIFLPILLSAIALGIEMAMTGEDASGFIFFWLSAAVAFFSIFFIYQVTNNYFTMKQKSVEKEN